MTSRKSVLFIPVPQAEHVVSTLRKQYDPGVKREIPAHITVLFPFKSPDELSAEVIDSLREIFARARPFNFSLTAIGTWPGVVYLQPTPHTPFVDLTKMIVARFPENPWFGGEFPDINPHLTIANEISKDIFVQVKSEIMAMVKGHLPIDAKAQEVYLYEEGEGDIWTHTQTFALRY